MTFNDINEIKKAGFTGFIKMSELFLDCSLIPDTKGVYLVLNLSSKTRSFLPIGTGGYFKGRNPNVPLIELESNWVENTKVIYIGKATSLKKRLGQYLRFGQGKNVGHYGGRLIWQLRDSENFIVCWKTLELEDPRQAETALIELFKSRFGVRPFANLAD